MTIGLDAGFAAPASAGKTLVLPNAAPSDNGNSKRQWIIRKLMHGHGTTRKHAENPDKFSAAARYVPDEAV